MNEAREAVVAAIKWNADASTSGNVSADASRAYGQAAQALAETLARLENVRN